MGRVLQEGKGKIFLDSEVSSPSKKMGVFYNPYMQINRDLSILSLEYLASLFSRKLYVVDPFSASGIRAIRFLLETSSVEKVFIGDISSSSIKKTQENLERNGISSSRYFLFQEEASLFLRKDWGINWDYIDIDPFGSPVSYIESSLKRLREKGILGITATDMAPLAGVYPKVCRRRYGSFPLRNEFQHEIAIRILVKKTIEIAAQEDIALFPLFSYYYRHHIRVFFQKEKGAKKANALIEKIGYLAYCFSCMYRSPVKEIKSLPFKCPFCSSSISIGGPMWLGDLWDKEFTCFLIKEAKGKSSISSTTKDLLSKVKEELSFSTIGFYTLPWIGRKLKISQIPPIREVKRKLHGVRTHFHPQGIRTSLPHKEVIEILKKFFFR